MTTPKIQKRFKVKHLIYFFIAFFFLLYLSNWFFGDEYTPAPTLIPDNKVDDIQQKTSLKEPPKYTGEIKTLSDFTISPFCKIYTCKKEDSWALQSGGINHYYQIPLGGDRYNYVTIEIVIINNKVKSFGLMYFDREISGLRQGDEEIVYNLLNSINSNQNIEQVRNYIAENIEREISQIMQAPSFVWDSFNIYAGKVGQQTVSIKSVN